MKYKFYLIFFTSCLAGISYSKTANVVYTYPLDKSIEIHPSSNIGFTFSEPLSKASVSQDKCLVHSADKTFSGILRLSDDLKTIIFIPSEPFPFGENITAGIGGLVTMSGRTTSPYSISFTVSKSIVQPDPNFHSDDPILEQQLHPERREAKQFLHALEPEYTPQFKILVNNNPEDGNIYLAGQKPYAYAAVLDKNGNAISVTGNPFVHYLGFIPYPNGTYSYFDNTENFFEITDTNYNVIDSIGAIGKQYLTDWHELRKTAEGNIIIIGDEYIKTDMRQYIAGGDSAAVVIAPTILEYDKSRNLLFQWRTFDHFKVTDATHEELKAHIIDFCHMNAIEIDSNNTLVVSSRNMDEITKIDRTTGNILWRFGGKNNQFTLAGDTMFFSHQHAIRRTSEGTYTLFDNGMYRQTKDTFSRALEYRMDEKNKIATRVWEFRHHPDVYGKIMGYVQRLPNKGTLIGWGDCDTLAITEIDSNNVTQFELAMLNHDYSYRAYKYPVNYTRQNISASVHTATTSKIGISCNPNPVIEKGKIECTLASAGNLSIALFDQLGREISQLWQGYMEPGVHWFELDPSNMIAGTYYIRAYMGGGSSTTQIIVLK